MERTFDNQLIPAIKKMVYEESKRFQDSDLAKIVLVTDVYTVKSNYDYEPDVYLMRLRVIPPDSSGLTFLESGPKRKIGMNATQWLKLKVAEVILDYNMQKYGPVDEDHQYQPKNFKKPEYTLLELYHKQIIPRHKQLILQNKWGSTILISSSAYWVTIIASNPGWDNE